MELIMIPPVDVFVNNEQLKVVRFSVPGFSKKDLSLRHYDGRLELKANKDPQKDVRYILRTIEDNSKVYVTVKIGRKCEVKGAEYKEGILEVILRDLDEQTQANLVPIS